MPPKACRINNNNKKKKRNASPSPSHLPHRRIPDCRIPEGLVPGDTVLVKWEQKDDRSHSIIFNWKAVVASVVPELFVNFQCDEKIGQKKPDRLPFEHEGQILHEIRLVKPKIKEECVLAPPLPVMRKVSVLSWGGGYLPCSRPKVDPRDSGGPLQVRARRRSARSHLCHPLRGAN